jgi:hypothetical protein
MVTLKLCKLDDKGVEKCKEINMKLHGITAILVLMAIAAVINFFIGNAIGGWYLGWTYFGFSIVLSLIVILSLIPIAGLITFSIFFDSMVDTMLILMSITTNAWLDAIITITWWLALLAGIIVIIKLVVWIIKIVQKGEGFKAVKELF